jgi:hypothetical protein
MLDDCTIIHAETRPSAGVDKSQSVRLTQGTPDHPISLCLSLGHFDWGIFKNFQIGILKVNESAKGQHREWAGCFHAFVGT